MGNKKELVQKLQEASSTSQIDALRDLQGAVSGQIPEVVRGEPYQEAPLEEQVTQKEVPQKGYEIRPERKSERLQLRVPPSVLSYVKDCARRENISVNQWILEAIEQKK